MDAILPYLINAIFGAGGGWLASLLKKNGLGMVGNLLTGAVGGNILPLITSALGLFANTEGGNNLDLASIITALVGGGAGSLLGGLLKKT
jgi:uncharacterized membrane protein YeaQ/YmgE (transglycosylase-associated protein family)